MPYRLKIYITQYECAAQFMFVKSDYPLVNNYDCGSVSVLLQNYVFYDYKQIHAKKYFSDKSELSRPTS